MHAQLARSRVLLMGTAEIRLLWVQGMWEKKEDGHHTAGSRKTRAEGRGAGLGVITSISRSTRRTCGNLPAVGAGDVEEEGGMVSAQLEAVKREWRGG